jgi:hypothetical protein
VNVHDEGLMLQVAARIADGELPWRDFWWNYGPGQPFLVAGLSELFGSSLLTWRLVRLLLAATVSVLAYALARRDASEPLALGAWLAAAGAMAWPAIPNPVPAVLALGLGSVLLAARSPLGAGALAGLAIFFRLDMGLAVLAAATLAALGSAEGRASVNAALRAGLAGTGTAVVLLAPFALAGGSAFWEQSVGFAFTDQSLQRLPLPGSPPNGLDANKLLEHFFPYVLLGGSALWLLVASRQRPPVLRWGPVPLALAGVLYLLGRADEYHLIPLAVVLSVLLAVAAQAELDAGQRALAVALAIPLALIVLHGLDRKAVELVHPPDLTPLPAPVADGVDVAPDEARALARLLPYVSERVPPGEPVFVANPRHDLVNVGNPLLYVLLDRANATSYDVMQPGVVTSRPVQQEMVASLERSRPELVVRWRSPVADERGPGGAGRSSGVRVLDRYLGRVYRPDRRFGDYEVLARRER